MTPEELIEMEAAFLFRVAWPGYEINEVWHEEFRDKARSLNHLLNECGVRMVSEDQANLIEGMNFRWSAAKDVVRVQPLPEAKEGK
jgi:hypothetical protein